MTWVKPFKFSGSDRVKLRRALPGKGNHEAFIDAAQSIVETWRAMIQEAAQLPSNEERQDSAARIKKDAEGLASRLRDLPKFTSDQLDACLWLANKAKFRNLAAVHRVLTDLAYAASKLRSLPPVPRKRQHAQAIQMIRVLDRAYRQHFAAVPGKSRNSAFAKIVKICLQGTGFATTDPLHMMKRARKV